MYLHVKRGLDKSSHLFTFYMYLHVKRKKREGTFVLPKLRTNDREREGDGTLGNPTFN